MMSFDNKDEGTKEEEMFYMEKVRIALDSISRCSEISDLKPLSKINPKFIETLKRSSESIEVVFQIILPIN